MADNIQVTVSAGSAQGKSTVAQMIFDVMQMVDLNVTLLDDNGIGIVDERPGVISESIDRRITSLAERGTSISVRTLQQNRRPAQDYHVSSLVDDIRHKDNEIAELRARKFARFNNEDCWLYQGDGEDHLESLTCPVVISAADLQQLLQDSAQWRQVVST